MNLRHFLMLTLQLQTVCCCFSASTRRHPDHQNSRTTNSNNNTRLRRTKPRRPKQQRARQQRHQCCRLRIHSRDIEKNFSINIKRYGAQLCLGQTTNTPAPFPAQGWRGWGWGGASRGWRGWRGHDPSLGAQGHLRHVLNDHLGHLVRQVLLHFVLLAAHQASDLLEPGGRLSLVWVRLNLRLKSSELVDKPTA